MLNITESVLSAHNIMLFDSSAQTAITVKEQSNRGMTRAATAAQRVARAQTARVKAARRTARPMSIHGPPLLK